MFLLLGILMLRQDSCDTLELLTGQGVVSWKRSNLKSATLYEFECQLSAPEQAEGFYSCKGPPAQCQPQIRRENTISYYTQFFLERTNSGFTLSKNNLRYSESLPLLEASRNVLWYVLPRWRGHIHSFKTYKQKRSQHLHFSLHMWVT